MHLLVLLAEQFTRVVPAETAAQDWWLWPPSFFANLSVQHVQDDFPRELSLRSWGETAASAS